MEEEQGSSASAERTSASTRSQKHDTSSTAAGPAHVLSLKRRRGLGVVTPNACTECRKKRAKCDGQKPCGRCKSQKDVECVYEIPVRQSKEHLRHEIENLRKQQRQSDSVFTALVRPELWEEVLQRLRNGQPIEVISEWLGSTLPTGTSNLPSYAQPAEPRSGVTLAPPLSTYGGTLTGPGGYGTGAISQTAAQAPAMKQDFDAHSPWNFSSQSQSLSQPSTHPEDMQWGLEGPPRSRVGLWLQDQDRSGDSVQYRGVDQVLAPLESPEIKVPASTWTNITNDSALVQHLLALYFCWEYPTFASLSKEHFLRDYQQGRHRYCSPILVNALLALGCRFSTQPNTRANPNEPRTSGDHFFKESLRLLYREANHHTLTTIQALGIMSIREASCGRDSESWYYAGQSVRLAIEMGLHRLHDDGDEDELAVQAATFWGAFALDQCPASAFLPLIKLRIIGSAILPRDVCSQAADAIQGLLRSYSQLYTLRRTPSFVPYFLLTSSIMYLAIGASGVESTSPAAQSSTSTARPHGSSHEASSPMTVSGADADSSPLSLTTTKLSPKVAAAIKQGITDLAEMAPCHQFAEQALNILRFLGKKWNIDVDVPNKMAQEDVDNLVRPSTNSLNFFVPDVSTNDSASTWSARKKQRATSTPPLGPSGADRMEGVITEDNLKMPVDSLATIEQARASEMAENPLFWPFPKQGRPILPEGPQLEEAGFALL
ncbi:hypothetical protein FHL15_011335 [Xylaria flabelliformis]|uniref:Zn(2)-C6 fungal-type domain-containing protein n=1 Tax=Xylaria flabelliformis TaxID=2512241 RepID=A0A553HIM1_9PEZI|nr:hypothetical protein FHL15_011335 [Xylaria flabelliformis]